MSCSELALQIFRANKDLIMTNLESFVYDPMLEWIKNKKVSPFIMAVFYVCG